jgi:hypothetical protein
MAETPFDSVESALQYVHLLASEVMEARDEIRVDLAEAAREQAARRLDALQIVDYKLKQLEQHLAASSRILNDLRMLRRLLVSSADALSRDDLSARVGATPPSV